MTPDYDISVAGRSITPTISGRLIDLTLSDKRGFEADELSLTLDDADGRLDIPRRGAEVQVSLGFKETGLVDKGTYIVDEASHSGPPDRLTLRARSADYHKSLNEQKRRSFRDMPLGDILKTIAGDHGLEAAIEESLAWTNPGHIDQTDESDGHLLTRLGRLHDAIATVKAGRVLFMPMGRGTTAGGTSLPGITINRQDGDSHSFQNLEGSSDYSGVKANWYDVAGAVTRAVLAESESDARKLKTLLETFASEAEAKAAAKAEWNRIERGRYTMSLTLAIGRPDLLPETPVTLVGWKAEITGHRWICGPVEHTLNDSGLVTKAELNSNE
ncbi:phage late control gene D protein (GPD) [Rhodobiaceae bacterium]|nr:phage late control gene D protein (GPD) [Rhodobiaceae bacterium]